MLPLLAEVDGQPAGLAWGTIRPDAPDVAHVHQMWVAPDHRGLGLGRRLLERILDWAADCGARRVVLDVTSGNSAATGLYRALGFVAAGPPEPLRPGSALRAQPMRRELPPCFTIESDLPVGATAFWSGMTMEAVNRELGPLIRMTVPAQWRNRGVDEWPTGKTLFGSWILLFGVLPVDRHRLRLAWIEPDRGFREHSASWLNREWDHRRVTEPREGGCRIRDRVAVTGRLPWLTRCLMPVYRAVFRHRHRRLHARYAAIGGRPH